MASSRMKPWLLYVAAFYVLWIVLVAVFGFWRQALAHWPISVAMTFGSVVAGSTPLGGGTVAFPVLVLLFDQSPLLGRNFGMAIQALGMTSAMIFILCRHTPLQKRMLGWSVAGAAVGLAIGTFGVAPYLSQSVVKLLFSCLWVSFGMLTLVKNREICGLNQVAVLGARSDIAVALGVGVLGGMVNSIIGVGIEMIVYTVLVLRYRCDLKVAIPTAVSVGALASIMGIALHGVLGDIEREVLYNWLAAGPIVVWGAPFGAFLVSIIPRIRTLYFVAVLCVLQFIWTLYLVSPRVGEWIFVATALLVATTGFYLLYRSGEQVAQRTVAGASAAK